MKASTKILTLALAAVLSLAIMPDKTFAQQSGISYQVFYDQLSPYGQWMDNPAYGYVWVPDAGPYFVPYSTAGHWIMTQYGWTWVSDYDWGWAPFHYGRWDYDDYVGWFWVPDTQWGPSWVVWRRAEGYYGWAPMQPGISLDVYFGKNYTMQNEHWMFVRDRDFQRTNLNHYYANRNVSQRIIVNSTVIHTTYVDNSRHATYVSGPGRNDVQRNTGKTVNRVTVEGYNKPGQKLEKGRLHIYRPQVENKSNKGLRPSPAKVADKKDVKQPSERNIQIQKHNTVPKNTSARQQQYQQQGEKEMQQQRQQQKQQLDPQRQQQDKQKQQQQHIQQPAQQKSTKAPPEKKEKKHSTEKRKVTPKETESKI